MTWGIKIFTTEGLTESITSNTALLDGTDITILDTPGRTGNYTIPGFNKDRYDLLVFPRSGFTPVWWISGNNVFNWDYFNGQGNQVILVPLRRTGVQ